jgi:hypothetical protein
MQGATHLSLEDIEVLPSVRIWAAGRATEKR